MGTSFAMSRGGPAARVLIRVLPATLAVAGLILALASETRADGCCFTGGPSVRVTPNTKVEFRWTANFVGDGKVEIFDNPNGGAPIDGKTSLGAAAGHTIEFTFGGVLHFDTTYFFRVIHRDPTGVRPDLTNDPPPYPPFFTGAQAISNVQVESITTNSAVLSWEANVIGYGSVVYGTTALDQGPVEDSFNVTNHAIELTGLSPGTTYQFRVSNQHAIDGDELVTTTGQFTTDYVVSVPETPPPAGGLAVAVSPNPAAERVRFTYALPERARVRIDVYDAQGRLIARPVDTVQETGVYSGAWELGDASGIYFLRLEAGRASGTHRLVVVR